MIKADHFIFLFTNLQNKHGEVHGVDTKTMKSIYIW